MEKEKEDKEETESRKIKLTYTLEDSHPDKDQEYLEDWQLRDLAKKAKSVLDKEYPRLQVADCVIQYCRCTSIDVES